MNAQQLKNAILQEAIEGHLVPQDPNDEPASVLLARIRKEKEQLVKEGKLKKKDLEVKPISEDEIPFEIPESWEWCRLSDYLDVRDGTHDSPKYHTEGIPFVTSKNLDNGKIDFSTCKFISEEDHKKFSERSYVEDGDILFAMIGSIGNPVIVKKDREFSIKNVALFKRYCVELTNIQYIYYYLQFIQIELKKISSGGVQSFVGLKTFREWIFPLPPLAEQQRIVAKIEELLPKVEEYGKAQDALNKLNAELPERLKKSILQEAIEGRLVPQDPNDEPASVLLDKIRQEKAQLVKAGKLKKKDLIETPISEDEIPFEIPENWVWIRLSEISKTITKGTTPRGGKVAYSSTGIGFLRAENVAGFDKLNLSLLKYVTEEEHKGFLSRSIIEANDILITIAGTLGRTALVKESDLPLNANQAVSLVRLVNTESISLLYIIYALNSPSVQKMLTIQKKVTAIPNLTLEIISDCMIPLPPLAEQHRIVEKLEQLLGKIDNLKL